MLTFKDYTSDEKNDFNLFNEVSCDFNIISQFIKDKLNGSYSKSEIEFHNKLVDVRMILDQFIDIISQYENETENNSCEDA